MHNITIFEEDPESPDAHPDMGSCQNQNTILSCLKGLLREKPYY